MTSALNPRTIAFGWALILINVANVLIVVAKEKSEPIMTWMKAMTPHHWITHGLLLLILFAGIGVLGTRLGLQRTNLGRGHYLASAIVASALLAVLAILGFFFSMAV